MAKRPKKEVRETEGPDAFADEGYDETQPGQVEIVAGTVEHEKLLADPRATHYGPDVNVIMGPPVNVDVPHVQLDGETLTCTMGNWTGEPDSYVYQWVQDGTVAVGDGSDVYAIAPEDAGHSMMCIVSATNDAGTTQAPPSNSVTITATE